VHVLDGRVTGTLERFSTIVAGAVAALAGLCGSSGGGGISGGPHVHLASELVPRAFLSLAVVLRRLARDTSAGAGHGGGAGAGGGGAAGGSGDTGEMQRLALVLNAAHLALAELMPRMAAGVSRLLGRSGISSGGSGGGSSRGGDSGGAAPLFRRARAVFLALISQTSRELARVAVWHLSATIDRGVRIRFAGGGGAVPGSTDADAATGAGPGAGAGGGGGGGGGAGGPPPPPPPPRHRGRDRGRRGFQGRRQRRRRAAAPCHAATAAPDADPVAAAGA
jgi:hypothetical protein